MISEILYVNFPINDYHNSGKFSWEELFVSFVFCFEVYTAKSYGPQLTLYF